jgi:hypothetical protein
MTIFNSILHVVSEKKIFEISANQRLLWPRAAILDNRVEQKVTTIDQNLVRNISTKNGSNPSSGSWEEVCFTYFPQGRYVKLCPPLVAILDFQLVQKVTTLG